MPKNIAVLDQTNHKITNLGAPTLPNDATTKFYVDALYNNLDYKQSVRVVSTNPITAGTTAIDGVTLAVGDRILGNEGGGGGAAGNGIYTVVSLGPLVIARAEDYNADSEVTSMSVIPVSEGTVGKGKIYKLTTPGPIVLGTTALVFEDANPALPVDVARFFRATVLTTGGAQTAVVTHNLGNVNVGVTISEVGGGVVLADINAFTTNTLSVVFDALTVAGISYNLFIVG